MPGYMCGEFENRCGVDGCFLESITDWGWVMEALSEETTPGRASHATDIDAMKEINHHVLILEDKGQGVWDHLKEKAFGTRNRPADGQMRSLMHQASQPNTTVMFIRPLRDEEWVEVCVLPALEWSPVTKEECQGWLRAWVRYARSHKPRRFEYTDPEPEDFPTIHHTWQV